MNFLGHCLVAGWFGAEPELHLGAMLPDLLGMAGCPPRRQSTARTVAPRLIREGMVLHLRTDDAFHSGAHFQALNARSFQELRAAKVPKGPARVVAHLGTELLLDGVLHDRPRLIEHFQAALSQGTRLGSTLGLPAEETQGLRGLLERMRGGDLPARYKDPVSVLQILARVVENRPLLRVPNQFHPTCGDVLHKLAPLISEQCDEWLDSLRESLDLSLT